MMVRGTLRAETASEKSVGSGAPARRTAKPANPAKADWPFSRGSRNSRFVGRGCATLERGPLVAAKVQEPRLVDLRERVVAAVPHHGPVETIDDTRRPLYRHMILNELVGGPSIIRFLDAPRGDHHVDALVMTHVGFDGDEVCRLEHLPAGRYAVADYEGPPDGLADARRRLLDWVRREGLRPAGPVLQVHLMDPIDGIVEEQLQVPLA
jgi:effector-binding domain-containing protein